MKMERDDFNSMLKDLIAGQFENYYDLDGFSGHVEEMEWDNLLEVIENDYSGMVTYDEVREWLNNRVWAIEPDKAELNKAIEECYLAERDNAFENLEYPSDFFVDGSYFDLEIYWFVAPYAVGSAKPGDKIIKLLPYEVVNYYMENVQ